MANEVKKGRKPKQKPAGFESWTEEQKALYKGASYLKRVRILLRSAQSNLDNAAVIAYAGPNGNDKGAVEVFKQLTAEAMQVSKRLPDLIETCKDIVGQESSLHIA